MIFQCNNHGATRMSFTTTCGSNRLHRLQTNSIVWRRILLAFKAETKGTFDQEEAFLLFRAVAAPTTGHFTTSFKGPVPFKIRSFCSTKGFYTSSTSSPSSRTKTVVSTSMPASSCLRYDIPQKALARLCKEAALPPVSNCAVSGRRWQFGVVVAHAQVRALVNFFPRKF